MEYLFFFFLANFIRLFLGKLLMRFIFFCCSVLSLKICLMYEFKNIFYILFDKFYLYFIIKLLLFFICF